MTAPANRWKLGLFVLVGLGTALGGSTWLGMQQLQRAKHTAYAFFDEALTGLEPGSPIKFRGVAIGVVDRIRVGPDKKHLQVEASLYDDYLADLGLDVSQLDDECPLPENLRAQVVMSWVTGTSFVQVDYFVDPPGGPQQLPFPVGKNTLRTVPSTMKTLEDSSREVLRELPAALTSARQLLDLLRADLQAMQLPQLASRADRVLAGVDQVLEDVRREGTVAAATAAVASIQRTAEHWRAEQGPVDRMLHETELFMIELRKVFGDSSLPETMQTIRSASQGVADAGAAVVGMRGDLRVEIARLGAALAAIERLATVLERDPGALLRGRSAGPASPLQEGR